MTANALAQVKAALLDSPPPSGTVPSTRISIPIDVNLPPALFFFSSKPEAPLRPDRK